MPVQYVATSLTLSSVFYYSVSSACPRLQHGQRETDLG
jgi:hypothetical protein